jgi:glycyl-tRNA synthetase
MPEIGERLWRELRKEHTVEFDEKQSIGKRYARMDEAGTPFCLTIDSQTLQDGSLTVRHRDDQRQERIALDRAAEWLRAGISGT